MPCPLRNFVWASGNDEDVHPGNLFKQKNSLEKILAMTEPYSVITLPTPTRVNTKLLENLDKPHILDK